MLPSKQVVRTMSSREIAELTGSSHDNVLKTITGLGERGVVSWNETRYTHPQNGQSYSEFHLNYRDTMVVVSGYSVELRAKIIDRWQELEAAQAPQIPTTLSGALRLAAEQAEEIERQTQLIERDVCKILKANERRFMKFLIDEKIMYSLAGHLTPMAQHMDAGRFEVKTGVSGAGHAFNQAKFTPKGVEWIAGEWGKYNAREQA